MSMALKGTICIIAVIAAAASASMKSRVYVASSKLNQPTSEYYFSVHISSAWSVHRARKISLYVCRGLL